MKVAVRFSDREELKAIPILLRHTTGMMLPGDIYVISQEAATALREAGVRFTEVTRESSTPGREGVGSGERI
jgi:hypothetical protein